MHPCVNYVAAIGAILALRYREQGEENEGRGQRERDQLGRWRELAFEGLERSNNT